MSFHNLSISVLKVGRQLAGSLAVAAFLLPSLSGCLKEEEPVQPHKAGNVTTRTISLSSDYRFQVFYNLEQDSIISSNYKTDWDLAFDARTEGGVVYLNSAKFMSAWHTQFTEIEKLVDTTGFFKNKKVDASNIPDSLAIGNINNQKNVFWIDRGYDEKGDELDFIKVKFESVDAQKYTFRFAKQGSNTTQLIEINKNKDKNFVYFSFNKNAPVNIEPNKTTWDLMFTQYIHTFSDPYLPYLVTGVLLNPYNTTAAVDSTTDFKNIDRAMVEKIQLKSKIDAIGYSWKEFGFGNSTYKVFPQYNYIIRNSQGLYFKLHFIDFYNSQGTKGFPKFELQKL